VKQACVVGMQDDRLGEVPVAFLEIVQGASIDALDVIAYCTDNMASFKVPRQVHFVTHWPMTESGKIQKAQLRSAHLPCRPPSPVGKSG
jgi:fatty-acyl-CoA synthase